MNKKIGIIVITSIMISMLCACGSDDEILVNQIQTTNADEAYLNGIEEGELYVLHADNTYEKTVFNNATFEKGETADFASDKRIIWFQEDFSDIPTVYEGSDKVVMYVSSTVPETIILERYEDLGTSVGICRLKPLISGKFSISTDPDENNSFPESDADEILDYTNETLIVDKIQGLPLRTEETLELNEEKNIDYKNCKTVTKYGTISGLEEEKYYDLEIYEGTTKHILKLFSNVHSMGSCTVTKKLNYHFADGYLQEFELPEGLRTGYYSINAMGVFRYIEKNDKYSATTNYNLGIYDEEKPAEEDDDESTMTAKNNDMKYVEPNKEVVIEGSEREDEIAEIANEAIKNRDESADEKDEEIQKYDVNAKEAFLRFILNLDESAIGDNSLSASITTPNGVVMDMYRVEASGAFYIDLYAETEGQYTLTMKNMKKYDHDLQISIIDESATRQGNI